MRRFVVSLALLLALVAAPSAHAVALEQLPGRDGCVRGSPERGCAVSSALSAVLEPVVAPDGRHVYVSSSDGTIVGFRRSRTGALRQVTCISARRRRGCTRYSALQRVGHVALTPDGRTVYAGFLRDRLDRDHGVAVFRRDRSTGKLSARECWSRLGAAGCSAAPGDGEHLAVSADGKRLIAAGMTEALGEGGTALTSYAIGSDGRLSNPACMLAGDSPETACPGAPRIASLLEITAIAYAPGGERLYVAGGQKRSGQLMALDAATLAPIACFGDASARGSCGSAPALDGPNDLAVSPDGRGVYVAALNVDSPEDSPNLFRTSAVAAFAADPLAQAGCFLSAGTSDEGCSLDRRFKGVYSVAVTPNGRYVVATAYFSGAVVVLRRDPATQALRRVACASDRSDSVDSPVRRGCRALRGLEGAAWIAVSPDGRNIYATDDREGVVVLRLR